MTYYWSYLLLVLFHWCCVQWGVDIYSQYNRYWRDIDDVIHSVLIFICWYSWYYYYWHYSVLWWLFGIIDDIHYCVWLIYCCVVKLLFSIDYSYSCVIRYCCILLMTLILLLIHCWYLFIDCLFIILIVIIDYSLCHWPIIWWLIFIIIVLFDTLVTLLYWY